MQVRCLHAPHEVHYNAVTAWQNRTAIVHPPYRRHSCLRGMLWGKLSTSDQQNRQIPSLNNQNPLTKPLPPFSLLKHKRLQLIFDKNYFGGHYCILCQDRKTQTGCHANLIPVLLLTLFHFPITSEAFLQCKSFSSLSEKDPVYIWIFITNADIRNGKTCKIRANSSLPLKKHWLRKKPAGLSWGIERRGASITQSKISAKDP